MENGAGYLELLMDYIKDNYITTPDKCIEAAVIEFLKCYAEYSGLETYSEWAMKYYKHADKKFCEYTYNNIKKPRKYPKKDYLLGLAKVHDVEHNLSEYYTEDDYYRIVKETFEESRFKCFDTYYKIDNNSLYACSKKAFNEGYEDMYYDAAQELSFICRWFKDSDKRAYRKVDFLPNGSEHGVFNIWDITKKEDHEIEDDTVSTKNLHELIKKLGGDKEAGYDFLIKYFAHLVKYPEKKPEVAIFFSSASGSGKDTLSKLLKGIIGELHVAVEGDTDFFDKDNKSARLHKLALIMQETENIKKYNSKIKDLITCTHVKIKEKYEKSYTVLDLLRFLIFSNEENILKIEPDDRRWVCFKCYNFFIDGNAEFFVQLHKDLDNLDILQKFKNELMDINIDKDYNFQQNRPFTDFYNSMKVANTPMIIKWLHQYNPKHTEIDAENMCANYNNWLCSQLETASQISVKGMAMSIKRYFYINDIWRGINKCRNNKGVIYTINHKDIKTFIEEKYKYYDEDAVEITEIDIPEIPE